MHTRHVITNSGIVISHHAFQLVALVVRNAYEKKKIEERSDVICLEQYFVFFFHHSEVTHEQSSKNLRDLSLSMKFHQ